MPEHSDTPYSDLHAWFHDATAAESRALRHMTGYHVPIAAAKEMERRLAIIASDVAIIRDEWLEKQTDGLRAIIANIRKHSKL